MRLKARPLVAGLILLHVLVFALYLTLLQGPGDHTADVHENPPLYIRYVNKTSKNLNETITLGTGPEAENVRSGSQPMLAGSDCAGLRFRRHLLQVDGWYPASDARSVYVFSAYHDERDANTLAVIGAKTTVPPPREGLFCQKWTVRRDGKDVTMAEVAATSNKLPEGHGRRYVAVVITCPLSKNEIPDAVSIVTKKCATPRHLLKVTRTKPPRSYDRNFTVCLTPLNFRYGKAYELVEWIEMNRLLGADFFTMYNFSTVRNVRRVLDFYQGQGLVEVVNWSLPMGVDTWPPNKNVTVEIHYFGQLAALNECWRRNLQRSKYLVYTDLDEFIVPREGTTRTWDDVIRKFPSASALLFKNVFYRKEWRDPKLKYAGLESAQKYRMVTLLKTVRETRILQHFMRSKYIVRSDSITNLGVHNIVRLRRGTMTRVTADVGLLHHYRDWGKAADGNKRVTDDIMVTKYGDDLIERVQKVWSELSDVKMDIPIT